jgi:hypothetical protein
LYSCSEFHQELVFPIMGSSFIFDGRPRRSIIGVEHCTVAPSFYQELVFPIMGSRKLKKIILF